MAGILCGQRGGSEQAEPVAKVEVAGHIVEAGHFGQQRRAQQRSHAQGLQAAGTYQRQHGGQGVEGHVHSP
ncbi:hypothetical protein D3C80_2186740 [compost metagenome]